RLEERGPSPCVEALGAEHRNEVLVPEARLRAPRLDVVPERRLVLLVHVPGIPLVPERRHRVDAPMNEDAELGVLVPPRYLEPGQRSPRRYRRATPRTSRDPP